MELRFVADTMLGRLARWLRALGYDTLYVRHGADGEILRLARGEGRVLLTRDTQLVKLAWDHPTLLIQDDRWEDQIRQLTRELGLRPGERLLNRCLECNTPLVERAREEVTGLVPAYTLARHRSFWGCPGCGRIYWAGSHAERMLAKIRGLFGPMGP